MPTAEQMKQRSERIQEEIFLVSENGKALEDVPKNLMVDVAAGLLSRSVITPALVPPRIAQDVALSLVKKSAERQRDAAAARGSLVHDLVDRISNGEVVFIPEEVEGHISSWIAFCEHYDLEFIRTEFTVWSPTHDYAGTGDFLARSRRFPELGLICGDYKTSESGIWAKIGMQLAAIRYADFIGMPDGSKDTETLSSISTFWGVQLTGHGFGVVDVSVTRGLFEVFLATSHVARFYREFEPFVLGKSEFVETEKS